MTISLSSSNSILFSYYFPDMKWWRKDVPSSFVVIMGELFLYFSFETLSFYYTMVLERRVALAPVLGYCHPQLLLYLGIGMPSYSFTWVLEHRVVLVLKYWNDNLFMYFGVGMLICSFHSLFC